MQQECVKCHGELPEENSCFELLHRQKGSREETHLVCVECYGLLHAAYWGGTCLECPECQDNIVGHIFWVKLADLVGAKNEKKMLPAPVYFRVSRCTDSEAKEEINDGGIAGDDVVLAQDIAGSKPHVAGLPEGITPIAHLSRTKEALPLRTSAERISDRGRTRLAKLRGKPLLPLTSSMEAPGSADLELSSPVADFPVTNQEGNIRSSDRGRNKLGKLRGDPLSQNESIISDPEMGSALPATNQDGNIRASDRGRNKLAKLRGEPSSENEPNSDRAGITSAATAVGTQDDYDSSPGAFPGLPEASDLQNNLASSSLDQQDTSEAKPSSDQEDTPHLVEASLVNERSRRDVGQLNSEVSDHPEESDKTVYEAREVHFLDYLQDWKLRCACLFLAVVFVVVIVVVAVASPDGGNTLSSRVSTLIPGIEDLPFTLVALQDADAPQTKALQWVNGHSDFETMLDDRKRQLFAVATLAYANMANPIEFLVDTEPECLWINFEPQCDENDAITRLDFPDARLRGGLPPEILLLSALISLDFQKSFLGSSIPSTLGQLTQLTLLSLRENSLSGQIPTELGQLSKLNVLQLDTNLLTGPIPIQFKNMKSLEIMHLFDNELTGENIAELRQHLPLVDCQSKTLEAMDTRMTGASQEDLPMDKYILNLLPCSTFIEINRKTSTPSHQTRAFNWLLDDPKLKRYPDWRKLQRFALASVFYATGGDLWIQNDSWLSYETHELDWHWSFSGEPYVGFVNAPGDPLSMIRESVLDGDEVKHLLLFDNNLVGTIPPEIGLLTSLLAIDLSHNKLQGSVPSQISTLQQLAALLISSNHELLGPIPSELGLISNFHLLSASDCDLNGTIPTELGIPHFWYLQLDRNSLKGPIPSELGKLAELIFLFLNENQITSTIPTELGQLSSLQLFIASSNELSGQVPSELGLFGMAAFQDFSNYTDIIQSLLDPSDSLTTFAFDSFFNYGSMKNSLRLHSNKLTGTIPSDLARLTLNSGENCMSFVHFDIPCSSIELQGNAISGSLPSSFSPSLEYLDVSNNKLHGLIPANMGFGLLQHLDASNNALTGTIPTLINQWGALTSFNISSNHLSGSIPPELGLMVGLLTDFDVSENLLMTGTIPAELCGLPEPSLGFTCSHMLCGCSCECPEE